MLALSKVFEVASKPVQGVKERLHSMAQSVKSTLMPSHEEMVAKREALAKEMCREMGYSYSSSVDMEAEV